MATSGIVKAKTLQPSARRYSVPPRILADILAIPIQLLTLLFRALFSAGSGLVAPASILVALAFGARSKLLPTAA